MQLDFHQVDAFADKPFAGNPAMVYRLDAWLADELMQNIAAEHNLPETAFLVKEGSHWRIRWFTPNNEVALCGHATLAAAKVLFDVYDQPGQQIDFTCKSGELAVTREDQLLVLDFPALTAHPLPVNLDLEQALGVSVINAMVADKLLVVLDSEHSVRNCSPNFSELARLPWPGVIITARGERYDFVSRFFAPAMGMNEDPVTGSAHCSLIPYWSQRLKKSMLSAYQCSSRGGELHCRLEGERVKIAGQARLVASGRLWLD